MKVNYLTTLLTIVFIFCLSASVALAIADPVSTPTINERYVNRNLIETGDVLFYARYTVPYEDIPDDPISETFIFRLIHTDNVTELGRDSAYPYASSGYGDGLVSFYFDNTTAPTWGQSYKIRISGSPAFFDAPPNWDYTVGAAAYTSLTTRATNRAELAGTVIDIASDLENAWSTTLLESVETGTVLSSGGEIYFRNSIIGIQAMCPELFLVQIGDPDFTERSWTGNQSTLYEERFYSDDMGASITGIATLLTTDFHMVASIPILLFCVGLVAVSVKQGNSPNSGIINSVAIICGASIMGWFPWAMLTIISVFCFIYIGMQLFFKGAT